MSRRRVSKAIIAVACAVGLPAACAESSTVRPATESSPSDSVGGTPEPATNLPGTTQPQATIAGSLPAETDGSTPPMGSEQIDPGLKPYIDIAVADLAKRLTVDASEIEVSSATLVEWPDSSLGCPQPGMQYAQTLTDGAQIVLNARGQQYSYHAGGSRPPFLCEQALKAPPTTG